MMRKMRFKALQILFLSVFLLVTNVLEQGNAWAADAKVTPGLAVGGGYDDNILLTEDDKVSSSIITVSPSVRLDYKTLSSKLLLKADWDILSYLDESDFDRTNQYYRAIGNHRLTERWTTSADFKYSRDTNLDSYLQETGRVFERTQRDYLVAGGGVGYDLTAISKLAADYHYQTATYDGVGYSDYDRHDAALNYSHRLKNERDTLSLGTSYYSRSNDNNDVESNALDLGWNRNWTSIIRSAAAIGVRYTSVKHQDDGLEDENVGGKASLSITSLGLASTTTFRYFHDIRTTEEGDDVNVDNFYLSYRRSITERFGVGIIGRLVFSYKLFDQQAEVNDERFYWIEPNLFYRLSQNLDLSLRYKYENHTEFLDEGDVNEERNIIWLELSYAFPIEL